METKYGTLKRKRKSRVRRYPDRFAHIYLFESTNFEEGDFLLLTAYQLGLAHDAIVCAPGGMADVKKRMPGVSFLEEVDSV